MTILGCGIRVVLLTVVIGMTKPVFAQDISILRGMRVGNADDDLRSRGYAPSDDYSDGGKLWYMWYKKSSRSCVGFTTHSGKVRDIATFDPSRCKSNDKANAVVAGAAIAAILGAAIIAHNQQHHKDGKHSSDTTFEAEYDRGYTDGLHDGQFVNSDKREAYTNGYNAGQQERHNRLEASRNSYSASSPEKAGLRAACAVAADSTWNLNPGSSQASEVRGDSRKGEVDVVAGYQRAICTVENGKVVKVGAP